MLTAYDSLPRAQRIAVALDCEAQEALDISRQLAGQAAWMKVGMTLYYAEGPRIVEQIKQHGHQVFVDLKLHDIPHQVRGAAAAVTAAGADMLTVHASGGIDMMRAAAEGAREQAKRAGTSAPLLLGITVLTSFDQQALAQIGVERTIAEQVQSLASHAKEAGLDGVVCSPQEASMLREILGTEAAIVTPGVRPAGAELGDQSRVATPRAAFDAGASHLVIGRPITQAENRVEAWKNICAEC